MTGFGKAEGKVGDYLVSIQMRSLNSKTLDLNLRLPGIFKELESDIRKEITNTLYRGKVEVNVSVQNNNLGKAPTLNKDVFKKYFEELDQIAKELKVENTDPLGTISKFPEVFSQLDEELSESEIGEFIILLKSSIQELNAFRIAEGNEMEKDLNNQIEQIRVQLAEALQFEEERIENVRNRVRQKLEEHLEKSMIDHDRFEQEMIYFLEKFDVSEEKVRLETHCQYFLEVVNSEEQQGKKLNFIAQEIGREINTLGSKANHAGMQKQVVLMKESLEKIKEQVLNVL